MKSLLFFIALNIFLSAGLYAQPVQDEKREEKIQSLEIAFISRKLDLNPEEAQKFWPIYNEYKKEVRRVAKNKKSQQEFDVIEFEEKMIDIRKRYKDQFSGAVGKDRMNNFFKAEREFRGVLLNRIKNHPPRNENFNLNREKRLRN